MKKDVKMELAEEFAKLMTDGLQVTLDYKILVDGEKLDKIKDILNNQNMHLDVDNIISNYVQSITDKANVKEILEKTWYDNLDELSKGIYDKLYESAKEKFVNKTIIAIVDNMKIMLNCQDNSYNITGITEELLGEDCSKIIQYLQPKVSELNNLRNLPTFIKCDKELKSMVGDIFDKMEMNKVDDDSNNEDMNVSEEINGLIGRMFPLCSFDYIPEGLLTEVNKVHLGRPDLPRKTVKNPEQKTGHKMLPSLDKIKPILIKLVESNGIYISRVGADIRVILDYKIIIEDEDVNVNEFDIVTDIIKEAVKRAYNGVQKTNLSIVRLMDELFSVYNEYVMSIQKITVY